MGSSYLCGAATENQKNAASPSKAEESTKERPLVRKEASLGARVLQGEMIHGSTGRLSRGCDTFLGAWRGIYFKVCLSVSFDLSRSLGED